MADQQTAAGSEELDEIEAPGSRAEAIAAIDDTIVRRMVRLAVHVRGYAPYYVATLALFAFLAFGPRPDGGKVDDAAFGTSAASATGAAGAAGASGGARGGGVAPTTISPQGASTLLAGAAAIDGLSSSAAAEGDGFSVAGDASSPAATLPTAPDAPATPDFEGFDPGDVDYGAGDDLPDACTVVLPSPAPSVSPSREVDGAQTTAEAAIGMEAPADLAPYVEDAASAAGCPSPPTETVPLPAVPGLPV